MGNWLFGTTNETKMDRLKGKTIYWVRHAESCANIGGVLEKIEQPSLTRHGIIQAIILGTEFVNVNKKHLEFKVAYSSSNARTIMTALLSTRSYEGFERIIIDPYIGEVLNAGRHIGVDYQNKIMSPNKIKIMVQYIKDWLEKNWLVKYSDPEFMSCLEKLKEKIKIEDENHKKLIEEEKYKKLIEEFIKNKQCTPETKETFLTFIKSMLEIEAYKNLPEATCIKKFLDPKFLRGKPVNFKYLQKTYDKALEKYDDENRFANFYPNKGFKVAICFSHGAILKEYFEKKYEKQWEKLPGLDHEGKLTNTYTFEENSTGIHIKYHYTGSSMKPTEETNSNFCFGDKSFNRNINTLGAMNDDVNIQELYGLSELDVKSLSELKTAKLTPNLAKLAGLAHLTNLHEIKEITNKYIKL